MEDVLTLMVVVWSLKKKKFEQFHMDVHESR